MQDLALTGAGVWALLVLSLIVTLAAARKRYRAVCEQYEKDALAE